MQTSAETNQCDPESIKQEEIHSSLIFSGTEQSALEMCQELALDAFTLGLISFADYPHLAKVTCRTKPTGIQA